jgi:hypothetical protein
MNKQRVFRYVAALAVLTSLVLGTGPAFAQSINTLSSEVDNVNGVTVPFWQAQPGSAGVTYTFVAITHPSLSGMHSQIGLTATALLGTGSGTNQYGTATDFTISAGETHRLFIIGTPQTGGAFPAINTLINTDAAVSGIIGTDNPGTGYLRFDPIATTPKTNSGDGFQDITMLSFWGAVVFEGSNTGFAMEFIGDATDSSSHPDMTSGRFPSGVN